MDVVVIRQSVGEARGKPRRTPAMERRIKDEAPGGDAWPLEPRLRVPNLHHRVSSFPL